jgi:hypothetical protein
MTVHTIRVVDENTPKKSKSMNCVEGREKGWWRRRDTNSGFK